MKIDFDAIEQKVMPRLHGGEFDTLMRRFEDERIKVMLITLDPGASIGPHPHENNCEIYYCLSGSGMVVCDEVELISPGSCHYCPEGHSHSLINDGDTPLTVFAVIPKAQE